MPPRARPVFPATVWPPRRERNTPGKRDAGLFGNVRCLHHVIVGQAPAEAAPAAHHVQGDVVFGSLQSLRHQPAATARNLAVGPDFEFAVVEVRRGVLRFQRRSVGRRIRSVSGCARIASRRRRVVFFSGRTQQLGEDRLQRVGPDLIALERRMQLIGVHHSVE